MQASFARIFSSPFDLVVSNPPYIPSAEIMQLEPEVRLHDPRTGLDGGPDGLDAYRALARFGPALLAPNGVLVLEIGAGQAPDVTSICAAQGLTAAGERRDLGGHVRALAFRRG
jgi:release factor glutamine methyltransferase